MVTWMTNSGALTKCTWNHYFLSLVSLKPIAEYAGPSLSEFVNFCLIFQNLKYVIEKLGDLLWV